MKVVKVFAFMIVSLLALHHMVVAERTKQTQEVSRAGGNEAILTGGGTKATGTSQNEANPPINHGAVSGRVVDAEGHAVAGVKVTAYSGREYSKEAESGDDGSYAFEHLPPGKYHLKAEKDGRFTRRLPEYDIQIDPGAKMSVDLVLVPGGTFELTVVDRESKKPIAGAEVVFTEPESLRRITDAEGKVVLSGLGYEGTEYQIVAEGYARQMRWSQFRAETEPGKHSEKTIELAPEKVITGKVVDKEERPLPDAVVTIESRWQDRWGMSGDWEPAMTGRDGAFRLGGLEEGEFTYEMKATKEGYAPGRVAVPSDHMEGVQIVLRPGATVEGAVKDSKGTLIQDAVVDLGEDRSVHTDDKGRFQFVHVEAGKQKIVAEKGEMRSEETEMEIGWDDHVRGIELVLRDKKEWTHTISGKIVDDMDGKGLANITVRFWSPAGIETKTDASGRFALSQVPSGRYRLYLPDIPHPHIRPSRDEDLVVEDRDIQNLAIRLKRGAATAGRVLLPSGEGAWEAKLRLLHPAYGLQNYFGRRVMADSEGRFKVEGLHPAMGCRIRADLEGYAPGLSEPFNLRQEDNIENIVIQLKRPGKLSGTVKDDQGKPLHENFQLRAGFLETPGVHDGALVGGPVTPGTDGRFEIASLPPGKVRVELWKSDARGWSSAVQRRIVETVTAKETAGVDFVIESKKPEQLKGYIAGRVVSVASDDGLQGIEVQARLSDFSREEGAWGRATTGPDGSFRIEGLQEGIFELNANPGTELGHDSQELEGIPSPSDEIPVVLRRLCAVEGRVVSGSGKPVTQFVISDVGSKEEKINDPQGRFRLDGLQRGSVLLRAVAEGIGVAQECVELHEGERLRNIILELHNPWSIVGQVVRRKDGKPVAGATVMVESLRRDARKASVTDANGRFSISGVFPGKETLYVEHPDYGKPWFSDIEMRENALTRELTLPLEEPARVKGLVLYEGGLPYDGIEVNLGPGEYGYSREFSAKSETGYEGRYEFFPVPPGKYNVVWNMRDPELGRGGYWGRSVELRAGETTIVNFGEGQAVVAGEVTADGEPVRLAVVTLRAGPLKRWVQADDNGSYLIYGLEAGRYHVDLHLPGQSDKLLLEKDIDLPERGRIQLDFEIPREGTQD